MGTPQRVLSDASPIPEREVRHVSSVLHKEVRDRVTVISHGGVHRSTHPLFHRILSVHDSRRVVSHRANPRSMCTEPSRVYVLGARISLIAT